MSDDIKYDHDNGLDDWRACSADAVVDKSQDWDKVQLPQRTQLQIRCPIDVTNQAIIDANMDDSLLKRWQEINADLESAHVVPQPTIEQLIEHSIQHYGLNEVQAGAYSNVYRRTYKQLTK